ncbi:MAG: GGDEF domain-containing protein [Bulleidia sp.]
MMGKFKSIMTLLESALVVLMMGFVAVMIIQINALQGTARVINYAGIIRGATQREVKLEIAERPDDQLIGYLDEILNGLKFGGGKYDLVNLSDETYRQNLDELMEYWKVLKAEIYRVREAGYQNTDIVDISETYFHMADRTVSAAENYSQSIATKLRYLEFLSSVDTVILIFMMVLHYVENIRIKRRNRQLEQQAYTDRHTGLPNKSRCELFFNDRQIMNQPICCIVFDLNNLKTVNDRLGHSVGDQMIANFARLLRNAIPSQHFVGRYGGDEFMAVIHEADETLVRSILERLRNDVNTFNNMNHGNGCAEISYACGYALSVDYPDCSFRVLFDCADRFMYENKMAGRKQNSDRYRPTMR